jgi:hypothetical protein
MLPSSICCVSVVFLTVLCGSDTWFLILREEHRQRVFESRVQRRYWAERDEVTEKWWRLRNENFIICIPH